MKVQRTIRHFVFEDAERAGIVVGAGARLVVGDGRQRVTLAGSPGSYSKAADVAVRTRLWSPAAAQAWLGFEAVVDLPLAKDRSSPTSVGFRLSSDGVNDFVWDGTAVAWVPATGSLWTTETDVADHVGAFFTQQATRALQIVVNLKTTDAKLAPSVFDLKVLWASSAEPLEDAITRSLIPDLRDSLRPFSTALVRTSASTSSITIAALGLETAYAVKTIDAVFDDTADPDHLHDLLASFSGTTAALSSPIPSGRVAWVNFTYEPTVAYTTSRDYDELGALPAVIIRDARAEKATARRSRDWVVNKRSGDAVKIGEVTQGDVVLRIEWHSAKLTDHQRMAAEIHRYFANRKLLRVKGDDEDRRLWLVDEYADDFPPQGDTKDVHVGALQATIAGLILATTQAEDLVMAFDVIVNVEGDPPTTATTK